MNLTISVVPAGSIMVSAGEGYSEDIQAYSEALYSSDVTAELSDSDSGSEDTLSGEDVTQDSDSFLIEEESANAETDQDETENAENFEDEISIIDVEEVLEAEMEEAEEVTAYASTSVSGKLHLSQFVNYKEENGMKSVTVGSAEELILLSNCEPSELQDITIHINTAGTYDLTGTIKEGTLISDYIKNAAVAVSDDEIAQEDKNSAEADSTDLETDDIIADNQEQSNISVSNDGADQIPAENVAAEESQVSEDLEQEKVQSDTAAQEETVTAGCDYTFIGIGTADVPFRGKITGQNIILTVNRAFWGGMSSETEISVTGGKLTLSWAGDEKSPMIADVYQFDAAASDGHSLPVSVSSSVKTVSGQKTTYNMGSLIGIVRAETGLETEYLNITGSEVNYTEGTVCVSASTGNAGLICNTLESGKICLNGYQFPTNIKSENAINAEAGNAGALIGAMESGTELIVKSSVTLPDGITVTATGDAGGLIGLMESDATIRIEDGAEVELNTPNITGAVSAGGAVGTAENVTITGGADSLKITSPTAKGSTANSNAGGFIGHYILDDSGTDSEELSYSLPECLALTSPTASTTGRNDSNKEVSNAGGYFGYLEINGKWDCTFGSEAKEISFESTHGSNENQGRSYGAIAGKITSDTIAGTVKIQNMTIVSTYRNKVTYHGGLVGELGARSAGGKSVYLETSNVTITVKNPYADDNERGFGGLVGCLGQGSILKVQDETEISTDTTGSDPKIWQGGGIAGYADRQSVLELSGTTNLSEVKYVGNRDKVGWLVGFQDCALIYARGDGNGNGWTYKRGTATRQHYSNVKNIVNDIANYGQIIRLEDESAKSASKLTDDLITINTDHEVVLKNLSLSGDGGIVLASADDFALLSIAWNSRGYFSPDSSINKDNWGILKSKTIKLSDDIDLTGSGITGLSRDGNNSNEDTYAGTFDGQGNTLTLSIGESFGYLQDEPAATALDGCGKVYAMGNFHAALGIFARTNNATVENLILDGNITLSNRASAITAGGVAAFALNTTTIGCVTAKETITADCTGAKGTGYTTENLSVGGLYGAGSSGSLTLQSGTTVSSDISLTSVEDRGAYIYAGGVLGQITADSFTLAVNGLTVGANDSNTKAGISTDASDYAYAGGLVGIIKPRTQTNVVTNTIEENRRIEIRSLKFDNFTIDAEEATKVCGGLLGSVWANVGVYFMDNDEGEYAGTAKLTVSNAAVNAPKATSGVGGLAYRSSGIWEIRDNGIDIQSLTIKSGGDVGLLVCRGEKGDEATESIKDNIFNMGALYLKMTANWSSAYQLAESDSISVQQTSGVFDEFVAHTAADKDEITYNADNGVISLATSVSGTERVGVAENSTDNCSTYQNRTEYGKMHTTNACSRYYYDLDQCWDYLNANLDSAKNGIIDDPRELMLWSVYRYASQNIKHFFTKEGAFSDIVNSNTIGADSDEITFNMQKYSYYPIDISNDMTVKNVKIIFWNQEIETAEANNKSTQMQESEAITQHYTMHCGLFLNQLEVKRNTTVTVENVTFEGSIGKINSDGASGVLFADNVSGTADTQLYIATVELKNITFAGLKVNGCNGEYAPLLINSIGSYTTLDANGIKADKEKYTQKNADAAASSLIGNVGSGAGKQINLSFLNIVLPDKKAGEEDGIFSHATLLESFKHDGTSSVATYNFYMADEWTGESYTHGVTYGQEITETKEYPEKQLWYYDERNYGADSNRIHTTAEDLLTFSSISYLPYVYAAFDENSKAHEIKVNQRVTDITNGCGTYSHPYKITSEREMTILYQYMATGAAPTDWRVTITNDQSDYHVADDTDYTYSEDKTYQFNGSEWVQVTKSVADGKETWQSTKTESGEEITLPKDFMLQYLLNAYYDLQGSGTENQLELSNFGGFGIAARPFRGVITSSNGATVVLSGASTGNGLISYSYGSVVRDITISYQKSENSGKTLTYDGAKTSEYYPDECFGGVIGCVLGGDNIIDNVTVKMESGWLTLEGEKAHLIQAGGYVGSVCGGGMIFRNIPKGTALSDTNIAAMDDTHMYVNPYVGRVLDGFAFYEVSDTGKYESSLNNTDKNYKINTLTAGEGSVEVASDGTVQVKDAQGLLLLTAIVNSGAASSGTNNAYSSTAEGTTYLTTDKSATYCFAGKYGKVRNAAYGNIKDIADETEKTKSCADDQAAPGTDSNSMPYLIQKYCGANQTIFQLCNGADIELTSGEDYDMTDYGSGYQGFAARYVSSAILEGNTAEAKGIVPELTAIKGNPATVIIDTQVKEYTDDDFKAASVGGIFNLLRVKDGTVSGLTICGKSKTAETTESYSGVSLQYYDASGAPVVNNESSVDAGAFAGAVSGLSAESTTGTVAFESVILQNLAVSGPENAGGLLGSSKKTEALEKNETGTALLFKSQKNVFSVGITVKDTKYDTITVTASNAAGGFVGLIDNESGTSLAVTSAGSQTGKDSAIGKTDNTTVYAGGAFGYVKSTVNLNAGGDETYQKAVLQDVKVRAKQCAGGFIGKIDGSAYRLNQATFMGTEAGEAIVSAEGAQYYAGGIAGLASGSGAECAIQDCQIILAQITESNQNSKDSGVASGHGGIVGRVQNAQVKISACEVQNTSVTGGKAGGIVGNTAVRTVIEGCKVLGSDTQKYEITGSEAAGGIIGLSDASGQKIQIEQCRVWKMKMTSKNWGCGGMLGDVNWDAVLDTLYLFDCAVESSEVSGDNSSNVPAGGFMGDLRGKLSASNILLSDVQIHTGLENKVGMIIGMTDNRTGGVGEKKPGIVSVAGLSIQGVNAYYGTDPTKNTLTDLYGVIADGTKTTTENNMKSYSYFAFADYSGKALGYQEGEEDTEAVYPYVVTSPKSALSLYENEAAAEAQILYGDGAYWEGDNTVIGVTIWKNKDAATDGHYAYSSITNQDAPGYVKDFSFTNAFSTYNANQTNKAAADFPVLQISGGNTDKIKDYLNILTNGGFSAANHVNTSGNVHVSATTQVYEYKTDENGENGRFVKNPNASPALTVNVDSNKNITFSTTAEYDNDKGRFTMLTVTFTETDVNGRKHNYNVLVPVLVRRMLEIDFTATLTYGTDFKSSDYTNLEHHVLESFGSAITGYLTYTYNSAAGEYTDYGWESYINAGGNLLDIQKSIKFTTPTESFPSGTQFTLVDADSKKAYYYSATGSEKYESNGISIPLSAFKDAAGEKSYEEPSISELIHATATPDGDNLLFVKVNSDGSPTENSDADKVYPKPTVRIKNETTGDYEYYRLAAADLEEQGSYSITVDEDQLKETENGRTCSSVSESYYLVITVPQNDTTAESSALNGYVDTTVSSAIPHQVHYQIIKGGEDIHRDTASTYQLSNGYQQNLEQIKDETATKEITVNNSVMTAKLKDAITFPNSQAYNKDYDELYLRFVAGLQQTLSGNTGTTVPFPGGTEGTAAFYVYKEDSSGKKTYYTYNTAGGWTAGNETEKAAMEYPWELPEGGNVELPLSTGQEDAPVSLREMRTAVSDSLNANSNSTFYVEAEITVKLPATGLEVIPETKVEGTDLEEYAQFTYSSQLSTVSQSLAYSSNRDSESGTTKYYRREPGGAVLTYDVTPLQVDRLGINLQDPDLQTNGGEYPIDTIAVYDLSSMKNLEGTLKNSSGIKFTLTLCAKNENGEQEDYGKALDKASEYIDVEWSPGVSSPAEISYDGNGTWSWTVEKDDYYKDGELESILGGGKLTQNIRLKVKVGNVEDQEHFYSNYKVVLTAEVQKTDGTGDTAKTTTIEGTWCNDYLIYTLAKIRPEFVEASIQTTSAD